MSKDDDHSLLDTGEIHLFTSREPGEPPGTLEDIPSAPTTDMEVVAYGPDDYCFETIDRLDRLPDLRAEWPVVWLDVHGVGDAGLLREIGDVFDFHPLLLEDIQNHPQRPKWERANGQLYLIAVIPEPLDGTAVFDHIGIFAGDGFVVTLQYTEGDVFDPVGQRIRSGIGQIRNKQSDYLAYALLDAIIDEFFPALDQYAATLAEIEDDIFANGQREVTSDIHGLKANLFSLQRIARPQSDMIASMLRDPGPLIDEGNLQYFRDAHEHAVQIHETADIYRQMAANLVDLNLSLASHRMNEIMKVLTIIATIFIPLTFVAGVYGMNFDPEASPWNMPELNWAYGYPAVMGLMFLIALSLLWYFRRKGWIGAGKTGD